MPSYLGAIGTATPPHRLAQPVIADFMARALELDADGTRKLRALYRVSGIGHRYSVLPDYGEAVGNYAFFPNTPGLEPFPSVSQRMATYRHEALPLARAAAQDSLRQAPEVAAGSLTHLITVSCTGMYAPGLDIELVQALGLSLSVRRTCVNFMGCYAAVNALRLADSIVRAEPTARVLVVSVELCTLHFQKSREEDHLVSNALFGDGAAACLVLVLGAYRAGTPMPLPLADLAGIAGAALVCGAVIAGIGLVPGGLMPPGQALRLVLLVVGAGATAWHFDVLGFAGAIRHRLAA